MFFPTYFKDAFNQDTATAAYLGSMYTITAAVYRIFAGWVSDRITFIDGGIFMEGTLEMLKYCSFSIQNPISVISLVKMIIGSAILVGSKDFGVNICGHLHWALVVEMLLHTRFYSNSLKFLSQVKFLPPCGSIGITFQR